MRINAVNILVMCIGISTTTETPGMYGLQFYQKLMVLFRKCIVMGVIKHDNLSGLLVYTTQ